MLFFLGVAEFSAISRFFYNARREEHFIRLCLGSSDTS